MEKIDKRKKALDKVEVNLASLTAEFKKFKAKNGGLFK